MGGGSRGFINETTSSSSYGITGSFPHYKQITMPADQKAKLLAMHRASRANAGIYVAVVLAVYVILLTILLCRYAKRQRPSADLANAQQQQQQQQQNRRPSPSSQFFRSTSSSMTRKLGCGKGTRWSLRICCPILSSGGGTRGGIDETIHEITDFPMTSLTGTINTTHTIIHQRPSSNNSSTNSNNKLIIPQSPIPV